MSHVCWGQGRGGPCQHSLACPQGQCPSRPGDLGFLQNQSLLETWKPLSTCREHVGRPDTPPLSSSHLPACSDPGIPRNRSCQSQARGCAPPGHWTFSERFGCTPPCGSRTESSRKNHVPKGWGEDHGLAAWTWVAVSKSCVDGEGGWCQASTHAIAQCVRAGGSDGAGSGAPLSCGPGEGWQYLQQVLRGVWLA